MGLVGGILNFAGGLVGNILGGGYNQYARSTPAAQQHSWPGMKKSWPGMKDVFKNSHPGNSANAPGQLKKAEKLSKSKDGDAQVPDLSGSSTPQQAPVPTDPKATTKPAEEKGQPEVIGRKGPAGNDPKISQFTPEGAPAGYDGTMACGPTVGAMMARAIGYPQGEKVSDGKLIADLSAVAGTNEKGTTGNGMIAMFEHMGMQTKATKGSNLDWMTAELQAGHHVTALGDYYEVPGHDQPGMTSGHYLDIHGLAQNGDFLVNDPANTQLTSMTRDQMQNFITSAPEGGFAISAWKPTGVAVG
jgi:hypothetical protein